MLTDKMQDALNKQVNAEFYSAFLYLGLSAFFEDLELKGFAHWMRMQYAEEEIHALKLLDFIHERDGQVQLAAIDAPDFDVDSPLAAFELTLAHERKVTGLINDLVYISNGERDYATHNFLQWFVSEQVEEEANVNEVLQQLKLVGGDSTGLFMLDRDMAARPAPVPPAAGEADAAA